MFNILYLGQFVKGTDDHIINAWCATSAE